MMTNFQFYSRLLATRERMETLPQPMTPDHVWMRRWLSRSSNESVSPHAIPSEVTPQEAPIYHHGYRLWLEYLSQINRPSDILCAKSLRRFLYRVADHLPPVPV